MNNITFNEPEWIKLLFLLADTQHWVDELSSRAFDQLPLENKKKLFRKTYHLSIHAMAHIVERHYYKIPRHPGTGKFNIPLTAVLHHIREAGSIEPVPVAGSLNQQRVLTTTEPIGFDKQGEPTYSITIITDPGGEIVTAFPGLLSTALTLSQTGIRLYT
jgi:hypothetical protein